MGLAKTITSCMAAIPSGPCLPMIPSHNRQEGLVEVYLYTTGTFPPLLKMLQWAFYMMPAG